MKHPVAQEAEHLDFHAACRWLDAQAGERVAVTLFGPEGGHMGLSPIAVAGLLQPGIVAPHHLWGPGRHYNLVSGAGICGSFWLGEDVLAGDIQRNYLEGAPSLLALMAFEGVAVCLCVEITDAAAMAVVAEAEEA